MTVYMIVVVPMPLTTCQPLQTITFFYLEIISN